MKKILAGLLCTAMMSNVAPVVAGSDSKALNAAATGKHRSEKNIARNQYRNPVETLEFFGLKSDMTVIEISPGGMWYGEVIAPVVKDKGQYIAAAYDVSIEGQPGYVYRLQKAIEKRLAEEKSVFGNAGLAKFSLPDGVDLGANGSADMVLTFRNSHGWIRDGVADEAMKAFFDVLKPGGVLGLVQHRADHKPEQFNGYVSEAQMINLAEAAGFVLEARSEINANPKDTHDHPRGVWTLPPRLILEDKDREKYMAIGESDRMTLRFRKPS